MAICDSENSARLTFLSRVQRSVNDSRRIRKEIPARSVCVRLDREQRFRRFVHASLTVSYMYYLCVRVTVSYRIMTSQEIKESNLPLPLR